MLLGLQLGLPIVSTPAAAAPFGLHTAEDGASLGETPALLAAAAAALLADGAARARLGAAAVRRFDGLLRSNSARPQKGPGVVTQRGPCQCHRAGHSDACHRHHTHAHSHALHPHLHPTPRPPPARRRA